MENYSLILDQERWSYSRIQQFDKCPHSFFKHYICREDEDDTFLASYGTFIHQIHEMVFGKLLEKEDAPGFYLEYFDDYVIGRPPSPEIYRSYFRGGYEYFQNFPVFNGEVFKVEDDLEWDVLGNPFHGFADLIMKEDSGLVLYDHKAKGLKPYSGRKKPTKTDLELDDYSRQLYLYAEAIKQKYGEYPVRMVFNCYRIQQMIELNFYAEKLNEVLRWADERIKEIRRCIDWKPDIEFFKCRNLCGLNERCDYYDLM